MDLTLRHVATDRLRLDVTMMERGELFSWVGASRFDDAGIEHLVRDGPLGTGAYGGLLMVVFQQDAKEFAFDGNVVVDGRNLMEYSFRVQKADSHYRVRLETRGLTSATPEPFRWTPIQTT